MKLDPRTVVAPLVGLTVLVLVVQQTLGALRASGSWAPSNNAPMIRPESPYGRLDRMLAQRPAPPQSALRDPFGYPVAAVTPTVRPSKSPEPPKPVEPSRPTLTSVIYETGDARATIQYEGRDFTVRENSLFADFTVVSIRPGEVVVQRGGQQTVLRLARKGE